MRLLQEEERSWILFEKGFGERDGGVHSESRNRETSRMRVRLFSFRFSNTLGGFDDSPLLDFIRDRELLAFREHFFVVNEVPYICCVVTWQDEVVPAAARRPSDGNATARSGNGRPDPTARLGEADRLLFNTLREWRAATLGATRACLPT